MVVAEPADIPAPIREALLSAAASTTPRRFLSALNATGLINTEDPDIAAARREALAQLGIPNENLSCALGVDCCGVLRRNLAMLESSVRGCIGSIPDGLRIFEANDGGYVIMDPRARWHALSVSPAEISASLLRHFESPEAVSDPILVTGFSNPAVLKSILATMRRLDSAFKPRIDVLEPDPAIAAIGFSCEDLSEEMSESTVHWHIGREAVEARLGEMESRIDDPLPRIAWPSAGIPTREDESLHARLQTLHIHQREELIRLRARIDEMYGPRHRGWWCNRLQNKQLNILILSCRHTTFIRHAASDLAENMRSLGSNVRIVEEPDAETKLTALHYARAIAEHDPDIVIAMNFTRSHFRAVLPESLPYVCWIQDAMPQLFDRDRGRAGTEYDFIVGYLFSELFERYGYKPRRLLNCTVVASELKFHGARISNAANFCELAMVSHHGQSPKSLHESLRHRFDTIPGASRFLDELFEHVVRAAAKASASFVNDELLLSIRDVAVRVFGRPLDVFVADRIFRQYALPIADRAFRHETVAWAAELAERRGWRFKLFGNGWKSHHEFNRFAAGTLDHGDELRCAYQSAALHLHASITALAHQRVMECALSGGLCLPRMHREMLRGTLREMRLKLLRQEPDSRDSSTGDLIYAADRHPELRAFLSMWRDLGESVESDRLSIPAAEASDLERGRAWLQRNGDPNLIFGDLALNTFRDRNSFERLAVQAVEDPQWRQQQSEAIRDRVRHGFTHRVFANNLLELIRREFNA